MSNDTSDITISTEVTPPRRLTLGKGEKLRHRTLVESLFAKGESLYDFPFRLTWRLIPRAELEDSFRCEVPGPIDPIQMLITVPKKKRRRAVDRVLLRRRIREAYRLNRLPLRDLVESLPGKCTLTLAFIYIHDKNTDYALIERKMKSLLRKVAEKIQNS
ncbi:MAG: ribonuclease P protein component [Muribaculaceae bacterium]|nr:ribonuclease P protein component [Muribaculaceae bacterium]